MPRSPYTAPVWRRGRSRSYAPPEMGEATPTVDQYRTAIKAAMRAAISSGREAGREQLRPIWFQPTPAPERKSVPDSLRVEVFRRDSFTCCYCLSKVIPEPILRLLGHIYPDEFPHHPNWKAGRMHRAIPLLCAEVDHLRPVARGGSNEITNLRTACAPCNTRKADFLLEEIGMDDRSDATFSEWDGLTGLSRQLWESQRDQSGQRFDDGFQRRWARLVDPGPLVPPGSRADSKADTPMGTVTAIGDQEG
jgi:5-methylcytosine-specific restriction endonuclease McrA